MTEIFVVTYGQNQSLCKSAEEEEEEKKKQNNKNLSISEYYDFNFIEVAFEDGKFSVESWRLCYFWLILNLWHGTSTLN